MLRMDVTAFHKMRRAIQVNATPGLRAELEGMQANLRRALLTSGVFAGVEVEHTNDPDRLVVALCEFAPGWAENDVAELLERLWRDAVSYPYWEAHSFLVDRAHVEFQAATRNGQRGRYVTVHLIAQQARVAEQQVVRLPTQRGPVD